MTYHGYQISIHAPRVGSDKDLAEAQKRQAEISIHAPRVGSDQCGGHAQA